MDLCSRFKLFLFLFMIVFTTSCKKEVYQLRWKVDINNPLYFKVVTNTREENPSIRINDKPIESIDTSQIAQEMLKSLSKMKDLESYLILQRREDKNIDFKWVTHNPNAGKRPEDMDLADAMAMMMQVLTLQGTMNNSGRLVNSNFRQRQKNMIYMYCQLPQKPVSIGDTWELDIELIDNLSMYPRRDIENDNMVTLKDIKGNINNPMAIIEYDIFQSAEATTMNPFTGKEEDNYISFSFKADAKFDINMGRWKKFKGVLSIKREGIVDDRQIKDIELVLVDKLPKRLSKRLNGEYDDMEPYLDFANNLQNENSKSKGTKEDLTSVKSETGKDNSLKNIESEKNTNSNPKVSNEKQCPIIYEVQVLASKNKVSLNDMQFKLIKNEIYEVTVPNEVYKYKYRVGKNCSKQDAVKLKKQLQLKGFKGAFIIEVEN